MAAACDHAYMMSPRLDFKSPSTPIDTLQVGSCDFMVLSSDNDTGIVYTFQVPQSVIRQRLQITRSIDMYSKSWDHFYL